MELVGKKRRGFKNITIYYYILKQMSRIRLVIFGQFLFLIFVFVLACRSEARPVSCVESHDESSPTTKR
jgi:hypothetical protein